MIKEEFLRCLQNYVTDERLANSMWTEIEKSYSRSNRYYHTLTHLNSFTRELSNFKNNFVSWDAVVFAIAYHDIVYSTIKSNNEERSAELALKRLSAAGVPAPLADTCHALILATKKHEPKDYETNLFTDADLSILGSDAAAYKVYAQQIRREYSIYPAIVYNPGRKKSLMHFLNMDKIYKTAEFGDRYELAAKVNIQNELRVLEGK